MAAPEAAIQCATAISLQDAMAGSEPGHVVPAPTEWRGRLECLILVAQAALNLSAYWLRISAYQVGSAGQGHKFFSASPGKASWKTFLA